MMRLVTTLLGCAVLALSGCGLKSALTLPSQSDQVVIRAEGQTAAPAATPGTPAAGETSAAPADSTAAPATKPAPKKSAPKDDRIPPPPLPGGNPGTARGG